MFDAIFEHVDDPPATPAAGNPQLVIKWLQDHVREPVETYFAYEDASVGDIKACARAAGFTGNTSQDTLLTYMPIKSGHGLALMEAAESVRDEAYEATDSVGTLHFSDWVFFDDDHLGFFTIYDGDWDKYIQDFAEKVSIAFDTVFPHVVGAPPMPSGKERPGVPSVGIGEQSSVHRVLQRISGPRGARHSSPAGRSRVTNDRLMSRLRA